MLFQPSLKVPPEGSDVILLPRYFTTASYRGLKKYIAWKGNAGADFGRYTSKIRADTR
jgi:hypothetical protein